MQSFFMLTMKTDSDFVDAQADLSLLGAHVRRYVFSCCASFVTRCLILGLAI